jgi:hypothetical protein
LKAELGLAPSQPADALNIHYPRVPWGEILDGQPELALLPDEPYLFDENHREFLVELLKETPTGRKNHTQLVDGSLITWSGIDSRYHYKDCLNSSEIDEYSLDTLKLE